MTNHIAKRHERHDGLVISKRDLANRQIGSRSCSDGLFNTGPGNDRMKLLAVLVNDPEFDFCVCTASL